MDWKKWRKKTVNSIWIGYFKSLVRCTHSKDHFDLIHISQVSLQPSVFSLRPTKIGFVWRKKISFYLKVEKDTWNSRRYHSQTTRKTLLSLWFVLVLKYNVISFAQRLLLSSVPSAMNDKKLLFWLIWSCKNVNKAEMNEQIVNNKLGHHFVLCAPLDSVVHAELMNGTLNEWWNF